MDNTQPVSPMEGCLRCFQCNKAPSVTLNGEDWILRCERHGHEASGGNLEDAVKHWNIYISYQKNHHFSMIADDPDKVDKEKSYCTYCEAHTKTQMVQTAYLDRSICLSCYMPKYEENLK